MKRTDHDGLFTELLRTFFVDFVSAFLPNVAQYLEPDSIEFLDKEIIREVAARRKHTVDILVKARFRGKETCFLIHVENQAKTDADFPERMFDYFSWLREVSHAYISGSDFLICRASSLGAEPIPDGFPR